MYQDRDQVDSPQTFEVPKDHGINQNLTMKGRGSTSPLLVNFIIRATSQ